MKITKIYSEQTKNLEDMSKDRFILDMSWNEYQKLLKLIDATTYPDLFNYKKVAKSFKQSILLAERKEKVEWR